MRDAIVLLVVYTNSQCLDDHSGLRGVDVGSLPMIRQWVRDAIRETLTEYVKPNFVSIDVAAWLNTVPTCHP